MDEPQTSFTIADVTGQPAPEICILDIGAMPTGRERYAPLVDQGCARVIAVEPNPSSLAKLSDEERKGFIPHFLGDGKKAVFRNTRYPGCSSFLEPDATVIDLFETIGAATEAGNFYVISEQKVDTVKLDDLSELPRVDLLTIDTQGSELSILEHGRSVLSSVLVLETEVEFVPLYKEQPLFGHLQVALTEQGFIMHKLIDMVSRPMRPFGGNNPLRPLSQMLWADAVFVRDFTKLERFDDEALLRAATILNDVYLSYDLAFYFLGELDRRTGTALTRAYAETFIRVKPSHIYCGNFKGMA